MNWCDGSARRVRRQEPFSGVARHFRSADSLEKYRVVSSMARLALSGLMARDSETITQELDAGSTQSLVRCILPLMHVTRQSVHLSPDWSSWRGAVRGCDRWRRRESGAGRGDWLAVGWGWAKSAMVRAESLVGRNSHLAGVPADWPGADYERQKLPRKVDSRAVDRSNTPSLQKYLMAR